MNFFEDNEQLKNTFGIKKNQLPCTKFIDNIRAVDVKLINWPDEQRTMDHLLQFATGSWFKEFSKFADEEDYFAALEELRMGKILAQGLEGVSFSFLVSGLSLHGSHAIVRTRIGAAYLQQSQAVQDFRHCDILVPRAFQKDRRELSNYQNWCISGKEMYCNYLDSGDIAITDARFCLPKTIPVWINISMSLPTILSVYSKRTDVTEEHPEMNMFAELLRTRIVEKFPWMDTYFKRDANCIHRFEGYRSNCVFLRDGNDVLPPGSKENWTLHDKTKYDLMVKDLPVYEPEYFISYTKVSKDEYDEYNNRVS